MQPEIKSTKYYGYDKMFYYEKLIKQYIDMSTNVNENISKANVQAIYEIKTVIEDNLKPILAKFAIFWVICSKSGDYTSYVQYKTVVNSIVTSDGVNISQVSCNVNSYNEFFKKFLQKKTAFRPSFNQC